MKRQLIIFDTYSIILECVKCHNSSNASSHAILKNYIMENRSIFLTSAICTIWYYTACTDQFFTQIYTPMTERGYHIHSNSFKKGYEK